MTFYPVKYVCARSNDFFNKVVLSCTKDGSFCLHDKTDSSSHDFSTMISNIMSESAVSHVAINKGKNRVAISCSDGSISIWKL